VRFKIILTKSIRRPCFTTQHQTCETETKTKTKTKTKTDFFWSETGLVLRPTVSDHITGDLRAESEFEYQAIVHLG